MDPLLIVNLGVFVASAVAAWVAWEQARASKRAKTDAEAAETRTIAAREAAVKAQESAAGSLEEANRIAREAKQVVEGAEARKLEHHNVRWEVKWDSPSGVWSLVNRGPDIPKSVELTAYTSFYGHRDPVRADSVPVGSSIQVEFEAWAGGGGAPQIEWEVAWRTPHGALRQQSGTWPARR